MTDSSSKIPTDVLYETGVPVQSWNTQSSGLSVMRDVDWSQEPEPVPATQEAEAIGAIHLHYAKASHLLLCSRVRSMFIDDELDGIVAHVAEQAEVEMHVWGRYLVHLDTRGRLSQEMHTFYQHLFQATDPLVVILGMKTADIVVDTALDLCHDHGDPVFNDVIAALLQHNDARRPELERQLHGLITALPQHERYRLLGRNAFCIDLLQQIIDEGDEVLYALDTCAPRLKQAAARQLRTFYDHIGLTPER